MRRKAWECYQGRRPVNQQYVRELFDYVDGELIWRHRHVSHFRNYQGWRLWRQRFAGTPAGTRVNHERARKHRRVTIDGVTYYLSRVIWLYHYGEWPEYCWHRDGDRQNCAIENLESLSFEENLSRVESICQSYALRRWSTGQWSPYLRKNTFQDRSM